MAASQIRALRPSGTGGHQFIIYADSCSGVPGAQHEHNLAAINQVIQRLDIEPEFICFPGDEVIGLTNDERLLRQQWDHWFNHEMAWLDRDHIPLYHTTGNHTTYNAMSRRVFADVLAHLPRNGPPNQPGLSYFVRRDDLLMVFINTLWNGEGQIETEWLERTLQQHNDATYKLVFGHHPVFSVNGFSGPYQRDIEPAAGRVMWDSLVRHGVLAYVCSHILAFDVQIQQGVLQILTAGAGTHHRMPEEEYLHCLQATLSSDGLRYQILDTTGQVREWLHWPPVLPPATTWSQFTGDNLKAGTSEFLLVWQISGDSASLPDGEPQTLLSGWTNGAGELSPLWIGFIGPTQRLTVVLQPTPNNSPHQWFGPTLKPGQRFSFQVGLHSGMGPGGLLWRENDDAAWSTLQGASAWGIERLPWPVHWGIGCDQENLDNQPFRGTDLQISYHAATFELFNS